MISFSGGGKLFDQRTGRLTEYFRWRRIFYEFQVSCDILLYLEYGSSIGLECLPFIMSRDYGLLCTLSLLDLSLVGLRSHSAPGTNLMWCGKTHALEEIGLVVVGASWEYYYGWARV